MPEQIVVRETAVCRCSSKKVFLKISQYLLKKTLKTCSSIKKRLQRSCFPVNIAKFLRKSFLVEHLWWLLKQSTLNRLFWLWAIKNRLEWQKQPPEVLCNKKCSQKFQENTCARVSFLIKLPAPFLAEHLWWLLVEWHSSE